MTFTAHQQNAYNARQLFHQFITVWNCSFPFPYNNNFGRRFQIICVKVTLLWQKIKNTVLVNACLARQEILPSVKNFKRLLLRPLIPHILYRSDFFWCPSKVKLINVLPKWKKKKAKIIFIRLIYDVFILKLFRFGQI